MKFYMHAGSLNHGCEAIVRSTISMQDDEVELFSEYPDEDIAVHLDEICNIKLQGGMRTKTNLLFVICKAIELVFKNKNVKHWYVYKNLLRSIEPDELCLSIGGDNYCYGANSYLIYINRAINQRGARTGLWGCSIEPELLKDPALIEDMKRYSFISARESITFDALKNAGLDNIYLYPDPAFTLDTAECELPRQFADGNVVGINLSPLVQRLDRSGKLVLDNYVRLVEHILKDTDMNIALIPHVCKPGNDDRGAMKALASFFPDENRIFSVNQDGVTDCRKLKYIISKCRFMVTARTHASIAAYSSCVPTLVVGYSVKARGIAKDIFGTADGYVTDIRDISGSDDILSMFKYIMCNEKDIRRRLKGIMPGYIKKAREAGALLI